MYKHKASAQKDGQATPVSRHFKNDGHNHGRMQFSVIEWCTLKFDPSNTARGRRTELSWIFKIHSLDPIGINQFVYRYNFGPLKHSVVHPTLLSIK